MRMQGGSLFIDENIEKGSAVHLFLPVDQETARIVKRYRTLQMKVDEMTAKGLTSAIFVISKETSISWDEVAERLSPVPVINPEVKEMEGRDAFLWSLSAGIALALVTRIDRMEDPGSFLGEQDALPGAGWAVSLREGADLRDLVSLASERMKNGHAAHELKGVA
jgi:hypothetical protein